LGSEKDIKSGCVGRVCNGMLRTGGVEMGFSDDGQGSRLQSNGEAPHG
jgi:hypothetical protein